MAIFAADIGGTKCRFAIVDEKAMKVIAREDMATKSLSKLNKSITDFLKHQGRRVSKGAFSVAGPVTIERGKRVVEMTNGHLTVKEAQLEKLFTKVNVLNDFEALAHSIDIPGMITSIRRRKTKGTRVLVGPGTGLGQAIITDKVLLSEGSHSSIGLATAEEYGLSSFIKHSRKLPEKEPLSAELLLSGRGIASIYEFLRLTRFAKEQGLPGRLDAAEISASQTKNRCSKATMKWFAHFLAQHCKDLALTTYATGGLFLGGGILKKNKELLNTQFLTEFSRHSAHQYRAILENIPVSLITHTDAALLGAVVAMEKK